MTRQQITSFMGWCTVLNIVLLLLLSFVLLVAPSLFGGPSSALSIRSIHAGIMNVDMADLSRIYVEWIAHYKILVLVFNVVPYLALKLSSRDA